MNLRFQGKSAYAVAGVDLDVAGKIKQFIKEEARSTFRPEVLSDIGFFGGMFEFKGYEDPVLVSSVDGVGTKVKLTYLLGKYDTIGLDLVHHCVNDILTCGAEPLFFLDYIASGKLDHEQVTKIVAQIAQACRAVGCALIGGETAEMPGVYARGEYDLVGFIVGVVGKSKIINGSSISEGDAVLALASSGLHTNGYSLVRHIFHLDGEGALSRLQSFYPELGRTLGEELLEPHRCYYALLKPVLPLIKGLAHITGGGIIDNLPRILPQGLAIYLQEGSWHVPPIFTLIQREGKLGTREMYRIFNMGIGMVVICSPDNVSKLVSALPDARVVGEVGKQRGKERVVLK